MKFTPFVLIAIFSIVLYFGCSSPTSNSDAQKQEVDAVTFVHLGKTIKSVLHQEGDSLNSDEKYVDSLFSLATSGYLIDPSDSNKVWIYTNETELQQTLKLVLKNVPLSKKAEESDFAYSYLYQDINFIYLLTSKASSKLTCQDQTSSIEIVSGSPGATFTFYEHPDYGGKSFSMVTSKIRIIGTATYYVDQRFNLKEWCMKRSWIGRCTDNWNDKISSFKRNY
jgi:hypothetical protein